MSRLLPALANGSCMQLYRLHGVDYAYRYSEDDGPPPLDIDEDCRGDVYRDKTSTLYWIRRKVGWIKAAEGTDEDGCPRQWHPLHKEDVVLLNGRWIASTLIGSPLAAAIANAPSLSTTQPAPLVTSSDDATVNSSASMTVSSVASSPNASPSTDHRSIPAEVSLPPARRPSASIPCIAPPPFPVVPKDKEWLSDLRDCWMKSDASLSGPQLLKGRHVFDALIQSSRPINRIDPSFPRWRPVCEIFGRAKRDGCPPSDRLVMADLVASALDANMADSITNLQVFPGEVTTTDFLALQVQFLRRIPLGPDQRLLSALDIPATKDGLLQCKYGTTPFQEGVNARLSPATCTWTFPGAITYPHFDGVCGMYFVHLMGTKMWIFCPATEKNLTAMRITRTSNVDMAMALALLRELEGVEVLLLTDKDIGVAFYFPPNTIHCCLSFTESRHYGMPVRALRDMPLLGDLLRWERWWIFTTLLQMDTVAKEVKEQIVAEHVEVLHHYLVLAHDVAKVVPSSSSSLAALLLAAWLEVEPCATTFNVAGPPF